MAKTYFENQTDKNEKLSIKMYSEKRSLILNSMESMHAYREEFNWVLGNTHLSNLGHAETPIFSALIKNEFALYSCLRLTDLGLYGSARALLRSVFEALMIAKFASTSQSDEFIKKWISGQTIYFSNSILKKFMRPQLDEINRLWCMLCKFSHATVYAQQVNLDFKKIDDDIRANYSLIMIFLSWSYHLLNRHFVTSSMEYYTIRYRQNTDLKSIKFEASESINLLKQNLNKSAKKAIREYSATWELKI